MIYDGYVIQSYLNKTITISFFEKMIMRKTQGILALSLLLLSCGNKSQQQEGPSPNLTEKVRQLNDSSSDLTNEKSAVDQNKIEVAPRQPRESSTHSSSHHIPQFGIRVIKTA